MTDYIDTGLHREHIERETDRAYLFRIAGGHNSKDRAGREIWLPKAQIEWRKASPVYAETAHVPAWLARRL